MKVAIIGAAPTSRDLAPFQDASWDIWSCSPSNAEKMPRVDAWFEIHALVDLRMERWREWVVPYSRYLNTLSCPVYMQETNELVPKAIPFPKDEIVEKFGGGMFTSSISWMIALAVHRGATEIGIYGVDMSASTEYDYERPGCQHFIRVAREAGITVTVPAQSDLDTTTPLYGFGDANPIVTRLKAHWYEMQARIGALDQRAMQLEAEKKHIIQERAHLEGAIEENVYVRRTWFAWSGPDS